MSQPSENLNTPVSNDEEIKENNLEKADSAIEKVEEQIDEILSSEEVNPEKRRALVRLVVSSIMTRTYHSGPLPDGQTLELYNKSIPNGGDRVMALAERQQAHRHEMDKLRHKSIAVHNSTGQWMGFIIAMLFLAGGIWLVQSGHEGAGITLLTLDLTSLVAIFVLGKFYQKKSTEE